MARKSMKGGSPASRAVMSHVKTDSVKCNERFVAAANTHDVSNGDFYATTGGAYKRRGRGRGRGRSRRGRGKGKGKRRRRQTKKGGANNPTGPVFV
tara:strand:- start:161 stop:448 length:288 start_codon:yes stop_codon:yes gene_type:complete